VIQQILVLWHSLEYWFHRVCTGCGKSKWTRR